MWEFYLHVPMGTLRCPFWAHSNSVDADVMDMRKGGKCQQLWLPPSLWPQYALPPLSQGNLANYSQHLPPQPYWQAPTPIKTPSQDLSAPALCEHPNPEVQPHSTCSNSYNRLLLISFLASLSDGCCYEHCYVQNQFSFESDIPYNDLRSCACANLDSDLSTAKLGYRISGLDGPKMLPSAFSSDNDFLQAMTHICSLISCVWTKEYGIEIVNIVCYNPFYFALSHHFHVIFPETDSHAHCNIFQVKKCTQEDDIPKPEGISTEGSLTDEYKMLATHLKCESCKKHCYVMCNGEHQHLDYKEISCWEKQNVWYLSFFLW